MTLLVLVGHCLLFGFWIRSTSVIDVSIGTEVDLSGNRSSEDDFGLVDVDSVHISTTLDTVAVVTTFIVNKLLVTCVTQCTSTR